MPGFKVLIIHSANELFGADLVLLRVVDTLQPAGWQLTVLLPNDLPYQGELERELQKRNCPVRVMPLGILRRKYLSPWKLPGYSWQLFRAVGAVRRLIKTEGIELVYSATSAVWCGALAALRAGRPHVWHLHEIVQKPRWFSRLLAAALNRWADRVIAVSRPVRDFWTGVQPALANKLVVIHNGLDLPFYDQPRDRPADRAALGIAKDEVLIGCLGRIGSWKGQEFLLDALAQLRSRHPELKFKCLLGGGGIPGQDQARADLEARIRQLGLGPLTVFKPFSPDVRPWLNALDVMAVPSLRPDPFPTVLLEAMAARLPVVATNHGGPTEMVVPGETGFLVEPGDVPGLAAALRTLILDPALRARQGTAGRLRLEREYSLARFQESIRRLFSACLSLAAEV
ncbi:MAG: glycosyltransferase family 4 protein [candidate division FCPU426 bacterium]